MRYLIILVVITTLSLQSCVTKKKYDEGMASYSRQLREKEQFLSKCQKDVQDLKDQLSKYKNDNIIEVNSVKNKDEQIALLASQLKVCQDNMNKQLTQVGDLTVLSQSANQNVNKSLDQLDKKDSYIKMLLNAKSKADSINLALAVNLKSVLADGIDDQDINIKVDKTVVMINLSDKMLFQSGSYDINSSAEKVLSKIATIVQSRKEFEILVEGYTDDVPIHRGCLKDNWDLSVMRGAAVVRELTEKYGVDPNRLIAAGRGKYNALVANDSPANKALNRRTRIVIMPKLDQFYDLLDPDKVPK